MVFFSTKSLSQGNLPLKDSLYKLILDNYEIPFGTTFEFEKKLNKVFLRKDFITTSSDKITLSKQLIYDEISGYEKIEIFDKLEAGKFNDSLLHKNITVKSFYFDYYDFYGYDSSSIDAIEYYENKRKKKILSAKELELLSRAYLTHSKCYTGDFHHSACGNNCRDASRTYIDSSCFSKYNFYSKKSLDIAEELLSKHPEHITLWYGKSIYYYSAKVFDRYLELKSFEKEDSYIKLNKIYNKDILDSARTILNLLPQNSILFTFKENDTYPFLYLKEFENIRDDIKILNVSLLSFKWYNKLYGTYENYIKYPVSVLLNINENNSINFDEILTKGSKDEYGNLYLLNYKFISTKKGSVNPIIFNDIAFLSRANIIMIDLIIHNENIFFTRDENFGFSVNMHKKENNLFRFKSF